MTIVCISGGFDPIHAGHVDLIRGAHAYGEVIVILNSDEWLTRKKRFAFMPFWQRRIVLEGMRFVSAVTFVDDSDETVCEALRRIKPDYFANGGDRTDENTPELELCGELGITPLFGIGGHKIASSSELVNAVR